MATRPSIPTGITGFAINVAKYRKLTGEPVDGAKATECLIIPAGHISRFPPSKWGEFGSVRTYRLWTSAGKMPVTNVASVTASNEGLDRSPPPIPGGIGESVRRSGIPSRHGYSLPRMCDLSQDDKEAADGLRAIRSSPKRKSSESQNEQSSSEHDEHVELRSEGGSPPSYNRFSSDSEEEQERSVSGSDGDRSEHIRGRCSGLRPAKRARGLCAEVGLDQSQLGKSSEQEDSSSCSCPSLE